ncbi:MAG: lysostaphin resistance A-like protein [Acidimicrobiia bacterium]
MTSAGSGPARWSPWLILGAVGAGFFGVVAALMVVGADPGTAELFTVVVPAQLAAQMIFVVVVSRSLGSGSLSADFALTPAPRVISAFFLGVGAQVGFLIANAAVVELLHSDGVAQGIVEETEDAASTWLILVVVLAIGLAAPFVEELMFRGMMLRPLLDRHPDRFAIVLTASMFAAAHIFDVDLAEPFSWVVIGELFVLGIVLGRLAVLDRSLARPIAMHMGFNTLPLVLLYVGALLEP